MNHLKIFSLFSLLFLFTGCGQVAEQPFSKMITNIQEQFTQEQKEEVSVFDFASLNSIYQFSANLPEGLEVEYVSANKSINIFDPNAEGESNLEKSQLFIRNFRANSFLTLSTVEIIDTANTKIAGHDAVTYTIKKKSGVANFPNQPAWRNTEHKLVDVRLTKNNPSAFYVFSYNPEFGEEKFSAFTDSLVFHNDKNGLTQPLPFSHDRVTKKPFGIFVTPEKSPVDGERFSGYHTAVDYEISKEEDFKPVPVFAVCSGELLSKKMVSGYGGVVTQACLFDDQPVTVVYGHVGVTQISYDVGEHISAGAQITTLAEGNSEESGKERKHLHLGVYKGKNLDIRGYVPKEFQLNNWIDFEEYQK